MPRDRKAGRREIEAGACPVAAPPPIRRSLADPRPNRVENDVASRREQTGVTVNQLAPEAVAEEVLPDVAVAAVREAREAAVEQLHARRETAVLELDEQVEVVRHQHV